MATRHSEDASQKYQSSVVKVRRVDEFPFGPAIQECSCIRVVGVACAVGAFGQNACHGGSSTLRGQVTDPSGSFVTTATIVLTTPSGDAITAQTDKNGNYEIKGLTAGKYELESDCGLASRTFRKTASTSVRA